MKCELNNENDITTDRIGRVDGIKNLHVIDSSVFPSLPETTLGLLAMANATRIVNESVLTCD